MKLTSIQATIPVVQYGNIQPVLSSDDGLDQTQALEKISEIAQAVGSDIFASKINADGKEITATRQYKNISVGFDPATHEYQKGYLSGSKFAASFFVEPPLDVLANKVASKSNTNLTAEQVLDAWGAKGDFAKQFGTSIHTLIENRIKHVAYKDIDTRSGFPFVDELIDQALDHIKPQPAKELRPEFFVADDKEKLAGFIDLAVFDKDKKTISIIDHKTNRDLSKKKTLHKSAPEFLKDLPKTVQTEYMLQLNFYAYILERDGYKVDNLEIHHYNFAEGKLDILPIKKITNKTMKELILWTRSMTS